MPATEKTYEQFMASIDQLHGKECRCSFVWAAAVGSHDTVTGEWLEDKPTMHVRLVPVPDCPSHPTAACWECGELMVTRWFADIAPGWAKRGDGLIACPEHLEFMPPHTRTKQKEKKPRG